MNIQEAILALKNMYPAVIKNECKTAIDTLITAVGGDATHCSDCGNNKECLYYTTTDVNEAKMSYVTYTKTCGNYKPMKED